MEIKKDSIIGKTMVVTVEYRTSDGDLSDREKYFGTVTAVTNEELVVRLEDGEEIILPPDLSAVLPAEKGRYPINNFGYVIEDPDFVSKWTIYEG